jgi:hypothetical protein
MKDFENFELLEAYLQGELDDDKKLWLESRLQNEPDLQKQLELLQQADDLIILSGLHEAEKKIRGWRPTGHRSGLNGKLLTGILIIASVIGGISYFLYSEKSYEPLTGKDFQQENSGLSVSNLHAESDESDEPVTDYRKIKLPEPADLKSETSFEADNIPMVPDNKKENHNFPEVSTDINTTGINDESLSDSPLKQDSKNPENKCADVFLTSEIYNEGTCKGKSEGIIRFNNSAGGTTPYEYSIDGVSYSRGNDFYNLPEGVYIPFLKDASGCIAAQKNITIHSMACREKESAFAPEIGQSFIYPLKNDEAGEIEIFNSSGIKIYSVNATAGDSWDGRDFQGNLQPVDVYHFEIRLQNGKLISGDVSIVE